MTLVEGDFFLFFLVAFCFFQFFINKAPTTFKQHPPEEFYEQKFLNIINLAVFFNISCCGAIDNVLTSHVGGVGFDSSRRRLFSLFFGRVLFFFF